MLNSRNLQILILVLLLAASTAGGWVILVRANELAQANGNVPFSRERIAADKAFKDRDYHAAAGYFREMTLQDPYNCWAQFYLGRCLLENILEDLARNPDVDSGQLMEVTSTDESGNVIVGLRESWFTEALEAFQASSELRVLKTASIYHIARLHYLKKDLDQAMAILSGLTPGESRFQRTMGSDFADLGERQDFKVLLERQQSSNIP